MALRFRATPGRSKWLTQAAIVRSIDSLDASTEVLYQAVRGVAASTEETQ